MDFIPYIKRDKYYSDVDPICRKIREKYSFVGSNAITPIIVGYIELNNVAAEVSEAKWVSEFESCFGYRYALTVHDINGDTMNQSGLYRSMADIKQALDNI
jgi:hypothetical protein